MGDDPLFHFREDDLVRRLPEASLLTLGSLLNSDLPNNWVVLATKLGLSNEEIGRIRHLSNGGYEALRLWQTRDNTTIRVLRNVLSAMHRDDVLECLQKAKLDLVEATIVIRFESEVRSEAPENIPFKTVLLDFVRPRIHLQFFELFMRGGKYKSSLRLPAGSKLCWTSFVGEFRGQEIQVELSRIAENQDRPSTELYLRRLYIQTIRSAQSWLQEETLFFECHVEPSGTDERRKSTRRSISSTSSESSIELENDHEHCLPPAATGRGGAADRIVGYHPEIAMDDSRRAKTAEILNPHLSVDGAYILRPPSIANSAFSLSAVFRMKIYHFYIMKKVKTDSTTAYFVYEAEFKAKNVEELINFYTKHGLALPAPYTDKILLTIPIA